jgi:hypothetical protein
MLKKISEKKNNRNWFMKVLYSAGLTTLLISLLNLEKILTSSGKIILPKNCYL